MIFTLFLICHGLVSVALLGAITHQAMSVARRRPVAQSGFIDKFSGVPGASYTNAIIILYVVVCIGGALIYPPYRLDVRPRSKISICGRRMAFLRLRNISRQWRARRPPIGCCASPCLRVAISPEHLTLIMAFLVWWNFLVGHGANNIKGILP